MVWAVDEGASRFPACANARTHSVSRRVEDRTPLLHAIPTPTLPAGSGTCGGRSLRHGGWVELGGVDEADEHVLPPGLVTLQDTSEAVASAVCISPFIRGAIRRSPGAGEEHGDGCDAQEVEHGHEAEEHPREGVGALLVLLRGGSAHARGPWPCMVRVLHGEGKCKMKSDE